MGMRLFRPTSPKFVSVALLALNASSCALFKANVIEPTAGAPAAPGSTVPGYASVPHPLGLQIGDAAALFLAPDAPKREGAELKACDGDYAELEKKTKARDELRQGLLELVRKDPVRYHWCFYGKLLELEDRLRKAQLLDERQRAVVESYRFLAPLARVFFGEFHDSRYLRWAVSYYRRASELAFYRRVETSPALTRELIGVGGDETARGPAEKATSVLEKYGITSPERLVSGASPDPAPAPVVADPPAVGDRLPAMENPPAPSPASPAESAKP